MPKRRITLAGPGAKGVVVNAALLRDLLGLIIDGSQRALRMRTQGRSTARGTIPRWIAAASDMDVRILEGSTVLEIDVPTLVDADPEEFRQRNLFPEVDPELTGIDYLSESLGAATDASGDKGDLYDKPLLELFRQFDEVFDHGITSFSIEGRQHHRPTTLKLDPQKLARVRELEKRIPLPQEVVLAGHLDTIRHSDWTFTLVSPSASERVKGIAETDAKHMLQTLWGSNVVISGVAHFTPEGKVLRVEASAIRPAAERDLQLWAVTPEPLSRPTPLSTIRMSQGPRTGLNALIGQWPGDESDSVIDTALEQLS
jgi:hypothetical protein